MITICGCHTGLRALHQYTISKLPLGAINIGWLHRKADRNNDDDARMSLDAIYPSSSSFLIKISEDKIAIPRTTLLLGSGVLQQQLLREI
jgi:hypothetical protein